MAGFYRVRRQPPACPVKYPQGERSVFHAGVCRLGGTRAKINLLGTGSITGFTQAVSLSDTSRSNKTWVL
jgi:hypothetical protein